MMDVWGGAQFPSSASAHYESIDGAPLGWDVAPGATDAPEVDCACNLKAGIYQHAMDANGVVRCDGAPLPPSKDCADCAAMRAMPYGEAYCLAHQAERAAGLLDVTEAEYNDEAATPQTDRCERGEHDYQPNAEGGRGCWNCGADAPEVDVCLAGVPALGGVCGDPDCVCAPEGVA